MARRLAALAVAGCPASAWFDTGHMLVAEMAKMQLPQQHVDTVDRLLFGWSNDFPGMSDIVSSSVWPDHIKCTSSDGPLCSGLPATALSAFSAWHYVDLDYNPDHVLIDDAHATGNPSAIWALRQAMRTFSLSQSTFALNFMLRFAIHLVGDIHQPLHAVRGVFNDTRFGDLPRGDLGGNLLRIKSPWKSLTNLHLLWDAAGGLYLDEWPRVPPVELSENASALLREFPRKSLEELNDSDMDCFPTRDCGSVFKRWVLHVHRLAVKDAYRGVRIDETVSDAYIQKVREVSRRQLAVAGYRLADLLMVVIPFLQISSDESSLTNRPWNLRKSLTAGLEMQQALLFVCVLQFLLLFSLAVMVCKRRLVKVTGERESPLLDEASTS